MLVKDLHGKSKDELNNIINELKAELFMLRFQNSTGQLEQPHKINEIKKSIARVFTVMNKEDNKKSRIIAKKKMNLEALAKLEGNKKSKPKQIVQTSAKVTEENKEEAS